MNIGRLPDLIDRLAAEYVLGTLRHGARRRFERWMTHEPMARQAVDRWQSRLAPMAHTLEPVSPPPRVWAAIDAALFERGRRLSWWHDVRPWRWLGAAALACSLALSVYVVRLGEPPPAQAIAVLSDTLRRPAIVVSFDSRRARLELARLQPAPLPPRRDLELWLIPPQEAPVSLGVVGTRRLVPLAPRQLDALRRSTAIALSLEPAGGSPTGAPTGPVLFSGEISATAAAL